MTRDEALTRAGELAYTWNNEERGSYYSVSLDEIRGVILVVNEFNEPVRVLEYEEANYV